jgi:serine/threonine protein kinase
MLCEFFGEPDYVKVLDFGIAKALRSEPGEFETATGLIVGTPAYMSPEQIRASKGVDGRSDLYALGLIMAECLAGHPIIQTVVAPLILEMHLGPKPLDFPARVRRSPLWPVIKRATAKALDERYPGAFAMLAALEKPIAAAQAPVSAGVRAGRSPPQPSAAERGPAALEGRERQPPRGEPQRARAPVVVGDADPSAKTAPNPLSDVHTSDPGGERQWVRLLGPSADPEGVDVADGGVDPDAETWPTPRADRAAEALHASRRPRTGILLILLILGVLLLAVALVLALN